ncbi:MAG TPA: hypothetical protein PK677_14270, partial [Acidiphilium sp.]|nr:hypothetical protein [Acidiphilium sp.]
MSETVSGIPIPAATFAQQIGALVAATPEYAAQVAKNIPVAALNAPGLAQPDNVGILASLNGTLSLGNASAATVLATGASSTYTLANYLGGVSPIALASASSAITQTALNNSTKIATTAYSDAAVAVETKRAEAAEQTNATAIAARALLAGSSSQVFSVADATTASEALPLGQAQADFAAINGSASEAFTANGFITTASFTSTGTAAFLENPNYSASVNVGNTGYIQHYVAPAIYSYAAVNLGQAQADFAAINGSSSQDFAVKSLTGDVSAATALATGASSTYTLANYLGGVSPIALASASSAITQTALNNSTKIATTAYSDAAVAVETKRAEAAEQTNATAIAARALLAGSSSQVFSVADATTASEALPLGQAQADFAAINGSSSQD